VARSIPVIPTQQIEHRDIPLLLRDENRNRCWFSPLTIGLVAHSEVINTATRKRMQPSKNDNYQIISYPVKGGLYIMIYNHQKRGVSNIYTAIKGPTYAIFRHSDIRILLPKSKVQTAIG
jgi:hypothetical protein